jgi:hypothetical protein
MDMETWTWRHGQGNMNKTWTERNRHGDMDRKTWTWRNSIQILGNSEVPRKNFMRKRKTEAQAIFLDPFIFAHCANESSSFVRLLTKKQTGVIRLQTD